MTELSKEDSYIVIYVMKIKYNSKTSFIQYPAPKKWLLTEKMLLL